MTAIEEPIQKPQEHLDAPFSSYGFLCESPYDLQTLGFSDLRVQPGPPTKKQHPCGVAFVLKCFEDENPRPSVLMKGFAFNLQVVPFRIRP